MCVCVCVRACVIVYVRCAEWQGGREGEERGGAGRGKGGGELGGGNETLEEPVSKTYQKEQLLNVCGGGCTRRPNWITKRSRY